jgi:hypothetical protein
MGFSPQVTVVPGGRAASSRQTGAAPKQASPDMTLVVAVVGIAALGIGLVAGYFTGKGSGYAAGDAVGYRRAQEETQRIEAEAARKATAEAAKAANPFQPVNPLEGVETDPFEKTKKILNPFE